MFGDPGRARFIAETAGFIGLFAAGSWISIPLPPVPFTLQTLFVLLAGAVMGRYAVVPAGLFIFLGAMNLPLFHNGASGIGVLLGPTGGYLIGFIPAALVVGLAYEHRSRVGRVTGLAFATLLILTCGATWLSISTGMEIWEAFLIGMFPFLPGDALKAYGAHLIAARFGSDRLAGEAE